MQPRGVYRYRLATGVIRWFLIDLPTDADGRHRQHKRRGFPSHATAVQAEQHVRDAYGRAELGRLVRGQPELRAMRAAATAAMPVLTGYDLSICEATAQRIALDHDVIFSCVDRPWARAVLNQLPYTDLIPVIDGGLAVEPFPSGGMRNTTWRAHVITPGRPCLQCNGQIDGGEVARDRAGLFDSATYIKVSDVTQPSRENVSLLAPSVTASMLGQFVSLVVAPGGLGVPGPLRFSLSTHTLEHMSVETLAGCTYEQAVGGSDRRAPLIKQQHPGADAARREREAKARLCVCSWGDSCRT